MSDNGDNEQRLAVLRREAESSQRRYLQVLGEIKAKKATLAETMTTLAAMGCDSLAEAEEKIAAYQVEVDDRITDIRRLLA